MPGDEVLTVDPRVLGRRLALARKARGLTQQEVADTFKVARSTIAALESGVRRPRPDELVRLARLFGRPVSQLVRVVSSREQESDFAIAFRGTTGASPAAGDGKLASDIQEFEQYCRWYGYLERLLDAPQPHRYPEPVPFDGAEIEHAAEEVAVAERNRLGLGDGPLSDLYGLLESDVGLRVFAFPFRSSGIAGMYLFDAELGGCIAVNARHPESRRRWTLAHEYGHFLFERHRPEVLSARSQGEGTRRPERLMDAFAKHLLLPRAGVSRHFDAMRRAKESSVTVEDVVILARLYRVSIESMMLRLEELGRLPRGSWEQLNRDGFQPAAAQKLVPGLGAPDPLLPLRYEVLAARAFQADRISAGQLAEMLGRDRVAALMRAEELTSEQSVLHGEWRQVEFNLSAPAAATGR